MLSGVRVTLLVSGSIAAYKAAELVRELRRRGATVQVAMSAGAAEFISPLTLQTLSGRPVRLHLFDEAQEAEIGHIALADEADVVLVAPATANCLAKVVHGIADDLLSTVLLATRAPVVIAPAMNVNMWFHLATQENVSVLRQRGVCVIEPGEGELACGWIGAGRFPEIADIIAAVESSLAPKDLVTTRVVVTAGPTRESFDPIRFISNRSTGKMGYALAVRAHRRGAEVCLISGPTSLPAPEGIRLQQVETAEEMREAVFAALGEPALGTTRQFVFMAAAVSDHRPQLISPKKLKNDKSQSFQVEFVPCPDILKELGEQRDALERAAGIPLVVLGFAAESVGSDEELLECARAKLERKRVDLLFGNSTDAMGKESNSGWLLDCHGRQEEVATSDKSQIAETLITAATVYHQESIAGREKQAAAEQSGSK